MPYSPDLNQYDDQVIECSYRELQWHFCRARPDKAFPNAKGMSSIYTSRNLYSPFVFQPPSTVSIRLFELDVAALPSCSDLMQTIDNQITSGMLCAFVDEHIGYSNY